jgi:hypothetical protein
MTTQTEIDRAIREHTWREFCRLQYELAESLRRSVMRTATAQTAAWLETFTEALDVCNKTHTKVRVVKQDDHWVTTTDGDGN